MTLRNEGKKGTTEKFPFPLCHFFRALSLPSFLIYFHENENSLSLRSEEGTRRDRNIFVCLHPSLIRVEAEGGRNDGMLRQRTMENIEKFEQVVANSREH